MPLGWRPLSFQKRSVMRELWLMSENGFLQTALQYLVRDLDLPTKADRANVGVAITKLIAEGFITAVAGGVMLHTESVLGQSMDLPRTSDRLSLDLPKEGGLVNPTQAKPAELLEVDSTDQIEEIKEESERAGARTHAREATPKAEERAGTNLREPDEFRPSRKPLPEPPPGLPPAEPPLAELIVLEHAREYGRRRSLERPPGDFRAATRIAKWAEDNSEVRKIPTRALALQIVAGLFASDRAAPRRWPLSWAAHDPAEFLPPPPGCKPLVATSSDKPDTRGGASHESHRLWREPEWMRREPEPVERFVSRAEPADFAEAAALGREALQRLIGRAGSKAAAP
jgi:hypothetical protein